MESTSYTCGECGEVVRVSEEGTITRFCEHSEVVIVADLKAHATGQALVK
jgi:endogenous inhibitor of DNA gyrase (YacG/DUF329 family)